MSGGRDTALLGRLRAGLRAGLRAMRAPPRAGGGGLAALDQWRAAEAIGDRPGAAAARARLLRHSAGYHTQVSTDPVRLAAWEAALSCQIKPGTLALEIGTGCGILAMLAARAGATVIACESDPVLAAIGAETVARNGLADRITILPKRLEDLRIPEDLPRPADLLFGDVFADDLVGFDPFAIFQAAIPLVAADAVRIPSRAALVGALAQVHEWDRLMPRQVAQFDLSPLRAIAPMWDRLADYGGGAALRSEPVCLVEADLSGALPDRKGSAVHVLPSRGGAINGLALWLRLELAPGIVLEARPGSNPAGYYAQAGFVPFDAGLETVPGQAIGVELAWAGRKLSAALSGTAAG